MVKNFNESYLMPNVRTIGLAGGTGDGKSEITSTFADPKAKNILSKSIGETNSTLKERIVVYSESMTDKLILAVKLKEDIFEREDFNSLIALVVSKIVKDYGKNVDVESDKLRDDFIATLESAIKTKVNSRAVLTFLDEKQIKNLVKELADIFSWEGFFSKYSYEIYNKVKNDLKTHEAKDNSAKFSAAIRSEVEKAIDSIDKEKMWGILTTINKSLKEIFFQYFLEDSQSLDGYYYHVIDLDIQEESAAVIDAMFTSNNLRKGENLSIEVFCKEIVIYAPMHKKILELIKSDVKSNKVFMGKDGTVSIAVYDTKGLYHDNSTDEGNLEYFTKLLYSINYDALMLVCPLSGDSNEAKLRELYSNAMKQYNKQVPIFILNNKVDLFIDALYKELSSDDPLSLETSDEELSFEDIKAKVNARMEVIRNELHSVQHKNRKNARIISLPCYLKKDNRMNPEMLKEYNAVNAIQIIINKMAEHLESSSEKIAFSLSDIEVSDIQIEIDQDKVKNIISDLLAQKETQHKILIPALKDISDNVGKVPHGNGYNALLRRLVMGYGYTSNINESYFYNCHSFSINFPSMLRNLITQDLIAKLLDEAVKYEGGHFKSVDGEKKLKEIARKYGYFNTQNFIAEMVYYKALIEAEKMGFSYGARFGAFLNNSIPYFSTSLLDVSSYSDAIIKTLNEALKRVVDLHVLYG